MPKKPSKTKSQKKPQPQVTQVKAIERLLEAEDYTQAVRKIKPLVRRFPDHGGLRRLFIEALEQGGSSRAACIAAYEWAERKPNSLPAQEALLFFSVAHNHVMLADRVARKVRDLGGESRGFPLETTVKETICLLPDGSRASSEDMERFDIGKLHLDGYDFAGAVRWLKGLDLLPARNNYAFALFHLGRIDDALAAFIANWQLDEENLFALGWAVRLRFYRGDETGACGLTIPLAAATARRIDDALSQLDALLLLRQNQSAWEAFERSIHTDWAGIDLGTSGSLLRHLGACAACRLGKRVEARRLWRDAFDMQPGFKPATANLSLLDRDDQVAEFPAVSELQQVLPMVWTGRLRDKAMDSDTHLSTLTASNNYLETLYKNGDETIRGLVGFVFKHRAEHSDADAVRCLREFARLPIGSKEERFGFLGFLREQNLLRGDEPVEIWDGEQLRHIKVTGTEIYREPKESDLPRDLEVLLGESIELYNAHRPDEAEARLHRILQRVPDHPIALGNLSAVRSMQGRDDEALKLLRQVVERNPDYLFARCNLAITLIEDGEIDEAQQLLKGLAERERLHIQEVFTLYGALAMLHKAKGETDVAESLIASLESMVEDEDDERRLSQVKAQLDPMARFSKLLRDTVESVSASSQRKR